MTTRLAHRHSPSSHTLPLSVTSRMQEGMSSSLEIEASLLQAIDAADGGTVDSVRCFVFSRVARMHLLNNTKTLLCGDTSCSRPSTPECTHSTRCGTANSSALTRSLVALALVAPPPPCQHARNAPEPHCVAKRSSLLFNRSRTTLTTLIKNHTPLSRHSSRIATATWRSTTR
jgi:hypothetical protein